MAQHLAADAATVHGWFEVEVLDPLRVGLGPHGDAPDRCVGQPDDVGVGRHERLEKSPACPVAIPEAKAFEVGTHDGT